MTSRKSPTDKEAFMASLALFDRPESELRQRCLDESADVDAFVDNAFRVMGNVSMPPH
jgi:hypothetical protein